MITNYCTLFNVNYMSRGINLYNSLLKVSNNFRLYIFAFDNLSYDYLVNLNLKKTIIISLKDFEDSQLKRVKKSRTKTEYFWTCTGSTVLYLFKRYQIKSCTYLDADLYFYKNPKILIKESRKASCIISKHNYTEKYDQSDTSGIYCVQFMYFKNNILGKKILLDWRKQCIKWCYNRFEDDKFGDQKYLDKWPKKYKGVYVLKNLGGGLAPWNIQKYKIMKNKKFQSKLNNKIVFDMIFYHFHNLKFINKNLTYIGGYKIDDNIKKKIYYPYIKKILSINKNLHRHHNLKNIDLTESYFSGGIFLMRLIKRILIKNNFLRI